MPSTRRLVTQQQAADHLGVTDRTIRNWVSKGLITGYLLPTGRAVRVDLNEIESMLKVVPTRVARTPGTAFGPKSRIKRVAQPVVVPRKGESASEAQR